MGKGIDIVIHWGHLCIFTRLYDLKDLSEVTLTVQTMYSRHYEDYGLIEIMSTSSYEQP